MKSLKYFNLLCISLLFALISCNNNKVEEKTIDKTSKDNEIKDTLKDIIPSVQAESSFEIYSDETSNEVKDKKPFIKSVKSYELDGPFGKIEEYYKKELKYYPELRLRTVIDPDLLYNNRGRYSKFKDKELIFDSESGNDNYLIIYSAFLEIINGKEKYSELRILANQVDFVSSELDQILNGGGSGSGHHLARASAYFEYDIYKKIKKSDTLNLDLADSNNRAFIKLKKIYIKKYKEQCLNYVKDDTDRDIPKLNRKIRKNISKLNEAIKSKFLLKYAKSQEPI